MRKRLYLGGGATLIIAAVVIVLVLPSDDAPLQATFDHYAIASDGSTRMAVLTLSNLSPDTFQIDLSGSPPPEWPGYYVGRYVYADQVGGSRSNWTDSPGGPQAITIAPSSMTMLGVPLPSSVDVRRVGVWCLRVPGPIGSGFIAKVKALWMRMRRAPLYQAWCSKDLSWQEAGLIMASDHKPPSPDAQPVAAPEPPSAGPVLDATDNMNPKRDSEASAASGGR